MIYITGDTHGNWLSRFGNVAFPEGNEMTKDDYVIVCGDFGIWHDCKEERYGLDWLDSKPWTTLFVDGNHSNFDRLYNMEVKQWHGGNVHYIRPSIIHLMRGQVFEIENKTFFTFGGAKSHDIKDGILDRSDPDFSTKYKKLIRDPLSLFRINHESWWKQELPSQEEMDEGIRNLAEYDNKVDYVITHCVDTTVEALIGGGLYEPDVLTDYFMKIRGMLEYKQWFAGHYHIDHNIYDMRIACLFEQIVRLV